MARDFAGDADCVNPNIERALSRFQFFFEHGEP